jgi:hypothetical protein
MDRRQVLGLVRGGSALIVFVAIVVQLASSVGGGTFNPTRYFAFFTILSNLFGATLFVVLAARWRSAHDPPLDLLRGASVLYLTVTFFVVIALLSSADLQVAIPWVDFVVHKFFPVVVVLDWIVDPPAVRLTYRNGLTWLAFPLVWLVATLIRGAIENWYPYPFLDPAHGGYGSVAVVSTAILVGFLVLAGLIVVAGNALAARSPRRQPGA